MIEDNLVKYLFESCKKQFPVALEKYSELVLISQLRVNFWRGTIGDRYSPNYCKRNKRVFSLYKIIPEHCFDCFKIKITPRNVVELFKLMVVFQHLDLPKDNPRKCLVESRPDVEGTYYGFVYAKELEEAKKILETIREVVSRDISEEIPVSLKRGCSEFAFIFPEFERIDESYNPVMQYKDEWKQIEEFADLNNLGVRYEPHSVHRNDPGWPLEDAVTMVTWLKYAETIGDKSYLRIVDEPVTPFKGFSRPPFKDLSQNIDNDDKASGNNSE